MVVLMMEFWINSFMGGSQSLAVRFLKRTHKPMEKPVYYFLNEFCEFQTWLVEVAHVVNSVNLQTMLQWNWIVWALVSAIANQTKVAKNTKPINLAQPALFLAKKLHLQRMLVQSF